MRNSLIIIKKQLKDTLKNRTILIQFILFPIMTLVMENAIRIEGMPELFFTKLFSVMYIGMAPLTSVAAIISEEKEKNTLRVMMMANVKPLQYLLGVGIYVWTICMIGAGVMATGFRGRDILTYMCFMGVGFVISIVAGACVGIFSTSQMSATSLVMPAMMVLSFAPMLSMFNERIARISQIFYTQQLRICLDTLSLDSIEKETYIVMAVNIVILMVLFCITYKHKGLE
ncbi:MAG: ABC transporter permease [Lachnospiraceae bacterium]|nr:ABC transporter permease [Lachnospiraceae bacterium]